MEHEDPIGDDAYTIAATTYREAAAYVASFVAYVRQQADAGAATLTLEAAGGLTDEDRRVLQ